MSIRSRRRLLPPVAAVTTLGLAALCACTAPGAAAGGGTDRWDVVASFYPMAFLAERIGGSHVHVTSLTRPGQEPHDLEISARQTAHLQDADAVLYLKGLQPAVDDAIARSKAGTTIDAASLTTLEVHGNEVGGHAAVHDTHPGEEAGAEDPHVWLDPVRYAQIAAGVGTAFEKGDADHAADYRKNTAALIARLDELNTAFEDGLAHTRTRTFITTHAAFGYLAERYGLTEEAINGLNPDAEPSPARVRDLERMATADGVTTVFYETLVSSRTARTIAHDTGLRTDVLDPIEGITKKSRGTDYFSVQKANLTALERALDADR